MPVSDQCLSSLFLKLFTDGPSFTCLGRAFQWLTTLVLKNIFRTVVEHLGKNSFRLCPHRLCESVANWKRDWLSTRSFPVRILNVSIRSPRSLLCCSEYSPSDFKRSSYDFHFNPLTGFVAFRWIVSKHSMSFLKCGDHTCTQYSRCGRTYVLYSTLKSSLSTTLKCRFVMVYVVKPSSINIMLKGFSSDVQIDWQLLL